MTDAQRNNALHSYVLHVWEAPLPATVSEAAAAALDMGDDVLGQNPGFIVLARRLLSRYPERGPVRESERNAAAAADAAPEASVWAAAPLDGVTDRRAWKIGVARARARVVPFVARQANLLGLCVFDQQAGMAWLPDGAVLKVSASMRRRLAAPERGVRLGKAEVAQALRELTHRLFAPLGYAEDLDGDAPCYRLLLPDGWIRVLPLLWDRTPGFQFSFLFEIRHARSAALAAQYLGVRPEQRHRVCSAAVHLRELVPGREHYVDVHDVLRFYLALDSLETAFCERVLPLLEQCRTLDGLERHVNRATRVRGADDSAEYYAQDIAMAWLAGRSDWTGVAEECLAALDMRHIADRMALQRMVAELRERDPATPALPA